MQQKQRIVVFLPPAAVKACDVAAAKYGSSRSEVVRLAVAEGLRGAVESLQRLREVRLVEAAGAGAARVWKARGTAQSSGAGKAGDPLDPDRAVSALLEYGRAVRAADGDIDPQQMRDGLQMHAQVIGVAPDDLDEVLADVLGQLFGEPQFQPVADPSQPPE
ncbi:MAG: hypothetical protein F4137_10175 [Acidobacteria bacterium]|nr:hypothetical protein [Acidobacteriota bacterium]